MGELISVVVPIYNVEKYIKRCIESIINQTYVNLEIILVNDGSPDKCGEICEKYALKDKRIKVIHKRNGGLSDARNSGIEIAKGKYIGFVDSDDYIDLDMYEILYKNLKKNEADISICDIYTVYDDFIEKYKKSDENIIIMNNELAIKEMLDEKIINTSAWNKLYKIELFKEIRYPFGKLSEDLFTTYKLFHISNRICYIDKPKYYYVQTENSIMRSNFNIRKLDTLEGTKELVEFTKRYYRNIEKNAINRHVKYSISYLRQIIENNFNDKIIIESLRKDVKKICLNILLVIIK